MNGWDGCACAEVLAMGLGRPVQGEAGTSVSTDVQVSSSLHVTLLGHCLSQERTTRDWGVHFHLPLSAPSSPDLLPLLMAAEGVSEAISSSRLSGVWA